MSGTTPRQQLAAQIADDHPDWIVADFPLVPSQVRRGKPVVSVWRSDVTPAPNRPLLAHELTLHVYGSKVQGVEAENELDDILDGVMLSIERYKGCIFTRATRRQFADDAFSGFEILALAYSPNIYRAAVLQERSTP
jgi:hypothetical protein